MPDTQNRNEDVFAKYNAMSTEELQQLLREHASKPEGEEETSMEALLYIMKVLAQRRRARNEGKTPAEALEEFRKYYEEDEDASESERERMIRKRNSTAPGWGKRLVAAAAIVILIFSCTLTAKSFGFDLWEVIVKWTQETFHFGYLSDAPKDGAQPDPNDTRVFDGLQAALETYDIETKLVPRWIPAGYEEDDIRTIDTPKQRQFSATYMNGDKIIKVWIADHVDTFPSQIEQSEDLVEVYESGGIQYYIIENNGELRAAWVTETFECYILGSLSIEEVKQMVDSIKEG